MHVGHHVPVVDDQVRVTGHAEGYVQHRAVLRGVDALAREHRVASPGDTGAPGDRQERRQGAGVDPVLRVVEYQITRPGHHGRPAPGILCEQFA